MIEPAPLVLETAEGVASEAAERVIDAVERRAAEPGLFRIGLSGGRTPQALYRRLAGRLDPFRLELLFADERAVAPDHPDSNYRTVRETLLAGLPVPADQIHRMRGELADLEAAARDYEAQLEQPLDLLLLGIGEDGHTASLFPGSALLDERTRRVAAVFDSPKPPPRRLTITPRVIGEARALLVLATGADKAAAVATALASEGSIAACPARLARHGTWLLDRSALSGLARPA